MEASLIESRFNGARGNVEGEARLFVGHPLDLDEDKDGASFRREPDDRRPQPFPVEKRVKLGVGSTTRWVKRSEEPPTSTPVQELPVGNAMKPGSETGSSIESIQRTICPKQRADSQILGVFYVTGEASEKAIQVIVMVVDQAIRGWAGQFLGHFESL